MTTSTEPIRVRQLLSTLNSVERQELKKLLPPRLSVPEEPEGTKYPNALLGVLPKEDAYSLAGWITEDLLHFAPAAITMEQLAATIRGRYSEITDEAIAKVAKSKTTEPYLAHIRETRKKVRFAAHGTLIYEAEVGTGGPVVGHPDIRTPTQIFEVKMTGQLKQNWVDFLFQVFAYAALAPEVTDIYLVLPLQEILWHNDVRTWAKRADYRAYLETAATKKDATSGVGLVAALLIENYLIGAHVSKLRTLPDTVTSLPLTKPSQIFLSGPQSSKMSIAAEELAATRALIMSTGRRVFIHSQYIINLCSPPGAADDYHTKLLIKNLEYGAAMGARGVVVHVGKSTTQPLEEAMAHMRANTRAALAAATPDCPVLLETPAGQGTEVLRTWSEFAAFVAEINDPRLRICIDTCHVFACGEDPLIYLQKFLAAHPGMTQLIHFNDSATPCGSCLDRHAWCGQGYIGIDGMTAIAKTAHDAAIPMVVEY
jgi:deoxyribonuclease-4